MQTTNVGISSKRANDQREADVATRTDKRGIVSECELRKNKNAPPASQADGEVNIGRVPG